MPKIFEIFGYRVDDHSSEAETARKEARCPFMGRDCDGGGNRYASQIDFEDLRFSTELKDYFEGRTNVPSGVCSIQPRDAERPWIVCPRRLLALGKPGYSKRAHQGFVEATLVRHSGIAPGTSVGIWPEVKIKHTEGYGDSRKAFDYTFDYVLMPLKTVELESVGNFLNVPEGKLRSTLTNSGFIFTEHDGVEYVEDFPQGHPLIVEIMTSSTSGGNKRKRTTIPQAFEDAILKGREGHTAPGINYRQVWARMVSQLIVKSEAGKAWGGKTFWILQDSLADYISTSTALDLREFRSNETDEVNILSFSYGSDFASGGNGIKELSVGELFSGPVRPPGASEELGFQDMIRAPVIPPKSTLMRVLISRQRADKIVVPYQ